MMVFWIFHGSKLQVDVQTLGDTKLHFHFSHPYLRQSQNMPLKEYLESKTPKDINPLIREIIDSFIN
ncbi:hypothetical protein QG37_00082 [Candidozyma auris]|uniref:Uncharacterized protein n=1 Tax=Candidozyma auris TaxID=498019 RepID=A0A0L0P916_CANAR|nr:hypothetical protein QG37_00082 [[Candida] auris]